MRLPATTIFLLSSVTVTVFTTTSCHAFQQRSHGTGVTSVIDEKRAAARPCQPTISHQNDGKRPFGGDLQRQFETWQQNLQSFVAAGVVLGTAVLGFGGGGFVIQPEPANAIELSKGAIVVQTTAASTTTKTTKTTSNAAGIDSQRLLKTLFSQRKELTASLKRIETSIVTEFTEQQVWKELLQEIMNVEEDVIPSIKIRQPQDLGQTIKDLQKGKLNLLVNGEVINIVVEPTLSKEQDDLVIRNVGFKGDNFNIPSDNNDSPSDRNMGPIRTKLSELTGFWDYWNSPAEVRSHTVIVYRNTFVDSWLAMIRRDG